MRIDYVERQALYARARRERAEAIYRVLIAPLVRLFSRHTNTGARRGSTDRHAHA